MVGADDGEPVGFDISSRLRTFVKFIRTVKRIRSLKENTRPRLNDSEGRR